MHFCPTHGIENITTSAILAYFAQRYVPPLNCRFSVTTLIIDFKENPCFQVQVMAGDMGLREVSKNNLY
jgi:hypothetical protein